MEYFFFFKFFVLNFIEFDLNYYCFGVVKGLYVMWQENVEIGLTGWEILTNKGVVLQGDYENYRQLMFWKRKFESIWLLHQFKFFLRNEDVSLGEVIFFEIYQGLTW
jgi:hypothetical protein